MSSIVPYLTRGSIVQAMDVTLAATARRLAEDLSRMAATAAAVADGAVWLASRDDKAKDVAEALGVSEPAIRKAIRRHNGRQNVR